MATATIEMSPVMNLELLAGMKIPLPTLQDNIDREGGEGTTALRRQAF